MPTTLAPFRLGLIAVNRAVDSLQELLPGRRFSRNFTREALDKRPSWLYPTLIDVGRDRLTRTAQNPSPRRRITESSSATTSRGLEGPSTLCRRSRRGSDTWPTERRSAIS
jgi:hypothetical protein